MANKVCLCVDYYISCDYCPYKYNCKFAGKSREEIMKSATVKKAVKKFEEEKKNNGKK